MRKSKRETSNPSPSSKNPANAVQPFEQQRPMANPSSALDTNNKPKSMKALDLDDLFSFNEERKRLEEKKLNPVPSAELDFIPNRIFLNHVDSYHGQTFAKFLSQQTVGALLAEEPGEFEGEFGGEDEFGDEDEFGGEGEGEEELVKRSTAKSETLKPPPQYEIIGTVKTRKKKYTAPPYIKKIIRHPSKRDLFLPELKKCGFIIYDITMDKSQIKEAYWALKAIKAEYDKLDNTSEDMKRIRTFILISPILTWAKSKPADPKDPEVPLTEADYRKRKPHQNYKDHCALEKEVMQTGRKYQDIYRTFVVASGVTYGEQENILHYLFKKAWIADSDLPVFERGNNLIPMINKEDLASVLHNVLEKFPTKIRYIVAMEPRSSTLYEIVKSISTALGTGQIKRIPSEAALLDEELTQEVYDALTMNIHIAPAYIIQNMRVKWKSKSMFSQNISQLVNEYIEYYQLKAIKIVLHGPPAVGKTTVAKQLCDYYKIHYLDAKEVVQHELAQLKARLIEIQVKKEKAAEEVAGEGMGEYGGEAEEQFGNEDEINSKIAKLERNIDGNVEEDLLLKLFKDRLLSAQCQNQGYILDDFPQTIAQAHYLFDTQEQGENAGEENAGEQNKDALPDFVISLEASDEFLCDRVMGLTAAEAESVDYTEENMVKKLAYFRMMNEEETTVLNFFDELEIHPLLLAITDDDSPQMSKTVELLIRKIGPPKNFGPTEEEIAAEKARQRLAKRLELEEQRIKMVQEEREMADTQHSKMEEWARLENILKEEEEERLALQALPLRHYLMRYVLPTLTKGLIEVAKLRPSDPLDYLAEYLFRENPEGKMFEPDYVTAAEDLFGAVQQFQDTLNKIQSDSDVGLTDCVSQTSLEYQRDDCSRSISDLQLDEKQNESVESLPYTFSSPKLSSTY